MIQRRGGGQRTSWRRHQMETFSALLAFVRGTHRSPVNSPTKASDEELWCFLCAWTTVGKTIETLVISDTIPTYVGKLHLKKIAVVTRMHYPWTGMVCLQWNSSCLYQWIVQWLLMRMKFQYPTIRMVFIAYFLHTRTIYPISYIDSYNFYHFLYFWRNDSSIFRWFLVCRLSLVTYVTMIFACQFHGPFVEVSTMIFKSQGPHEYIIFYRSTLPNSYCVEVWSDILGAHFTSMTKLRLWHW